MKKILIAIVLATALAVPSFANFFNINLSGGYTTLAMTQVNNEIQDFANLLSASIIQEGALLLLQ